MSVVPIKIKSHLVSFFFKESDGKESIYGNKRVKPVLFSTVSSIGRIVRLLMIKADKPQIIDHFNLVLTISDSEKGKNYTGEFYKFVNGRNSWLMLPEEANNDINDLLEDIFKMAFVSYVTGCIENNNESGVISAIDCFINKYDLLEFGFSTETLRRLYYREKKNGKIVARFQNKKSPKTMCFEA